MDGSFMVPLALFGMIAAIVIVPQYLRSKERERMHATLRLAYEKGQPVPPELIEALQTNNDRVISTPTDRSQRDLRIGVVQLAIGLGLVAVGGAFYAGLYNVGGAAETFATFAAIGAIPIFVGVAFMILSALGSKKSRA